MNTNLAISELTNNRFYSFLQNDIFHVLKQGSQSYIYRTYSVEDIPQDSEHNYLFSDLDETLFLSNEVFPVSNFSENSIIEFLKTVNLYS